MRPDLLPKSTSRIPLYVALIFVSALSARLLYWQDMRFDAEKVESSVTAGYRSNATLLDQDGFSSLWSSSARLSNPNTLKHPPGYAILRALLFKVSGRSDTPVLLLQLASDAASAVMVLLISLELLPLMVAIVAALMVSLAPQFAWHSIVALPDSLASLPVLIAIYFLIRAYKSPRLSLTITAGAFIGLSCWLRANALLLAPFLSLLFPLLFRRGKRLRYALAFVGGVVLMIAPITLRNAVVFHRFVPLSLSAGHILLIGMAEYDQANKFGLPHTDLSLQRMEAVAHNRPEYANSLFDPDGFQRERERLTRGFTVIRSAPIWFLSVMLRRAIWMLRLERVRLVGTDPAVQGPLKVTDNTQPIWVKSPGELALNGVVVSERATASLSPDGQTLELHGEAAKYGKQFDTPTLSVRKDTEYLITIPIKIESGRMIMTVTSGNRGEVRSSSIIEAAEGKQPNEQPVVTVRLPFVVAADDYVRVEFSNEATSAPPLVRIGSVSLYELGPAAFTWTRYPRFLIHNLQKIFKTAVILPLTILGVGLLTKARLNRELILLLGVPFYYFCVQSALHSEYRYVLVIHYFLFVLAAIAVYWLGINVQDLVFRFVNRSHA